MLARPPVTVLRPHGVVAASFVLVSVVIAGTMLVLAASLMLAFTASFMIMSIVDTFSVSVASSMWSPS